MLDRFAELDDRDDPRSMLIMLFHKLPGSQKSYSYLRISNIAFV